MRMPGENEPGRPSPPEACHWQRVTGRWVPVIISGELLAGCELLVLERPVFFVVIAVSFVELNGNAMGPVF